ncbi:UdgX family uracil-DNA binding protein [Inquilinus limosus]|uniref:UdgX family uracil-DNA binding protein n=1 Tax=Inquilinus limosus TaxID=171674 RepID=UPI003F142539
METLESVAAEARGCTRCPLYQAATQTVFGEGPADALVVFVGEQPGDQEDQQGRPFVGPAGRLFDKALAEAGIPRDRTYVTNAVKHFKFAPRGKRRLHKSPNAYEIDRCKWWLDRELALIQPRLTVALGATAARALAGRPFPILQNRGRVLAFPNGLRGLVTVHPSSLLRVPDQEARHRAYAEFVKDLTVVAGEVAGAAAA